MDRIIDYRQVEFPSRTPDPGAGAAPALPAAHPLPPTRAARPARSRGVFFQGGGRSRSGRWILSALCVAAATISIVASAYFATPAFNAALISGNAGPGLVAATTQAPPFVAPRRKPATASH